MSRSKNQKGVYVETIMTIAFSEAFVLPTVSSGQRLLEQEKLYTIPQQPTLEQARQALLREVRFCPACERVAWGDEECDCAPSDVPF